LTQSDLGSSSVKRTRLSLNHAISTENNDPLPKSLSMIAVRFSYIEPDIYDLDDDMTSDDDSVY
jgi:hypothetical protein